VRSGEIVPDFVADPSLRVHEIWYLMTRNDASRLWRSGMNRSCLLAHQRGLYAHECSCLDAARTP
jgi:hypothetical protein